MADVEAQETAEDILDRARNERDRISAELAELASKLDQSQGELERLARNNANVTGEVKNLENDYESVPRATIREVYEAALDAQQRLFMMRGQVDKLQGDAELLRRYKENIDQLLQAVSEGGVSAGGQTGDDDAVGSANVIRIIDAQERERQRLANQMHDGPAQSLTNFILQAEICQRLFDRDADRAREELNNLKSAASTTFQKVRDFIFDLRPMMLDDLGLVPTVRRYVEAFGEKTSIVVTLSVSGEERRLEAHREVIIFRALQELLANTRDSAKATEATITLDMGPEEIRVGVENNGRSIGTGELSDPALAASLGLSTMQERLGLIGGQVHVAPGGAQGTRIVLAVPAGPVR